MLSIYAREVRDCLIQRLSHDADAFQLTVRERSQIALNRYLQLKGSERDIYYETIEDIIDHLHGGFPFKKKPSKYQRDGEYFKERHEEMWIAKMNRKKALKELELIDLIQFRSYGRLQFADVTMFEMLKKLLDDFEYLVRENLARYFARLTLEEHEHNRGYDLVEYVRGKEVFRKELYSDKNTTNFMKYMFENENKVMLIEEVYDSLKIEKKDRRMPQWIKELKIDEGVRKRKYIEIIEKVKVRFKSAHADLITEKE